MKTGMKMRTRIKGQVIGKVIELNDEGLHKFEEFRLRWGRPSIKSVEYCAERDAIYAQYGHLKLRTSSLKGQMLSVLKATRFNIREIFQVFKYEMAINHNIVTDEGDALIADLMATTPVRVKLDGTNGYVDVGTGWTGSSPKTQTVLNTPTGTPELMDGTYPKIKGAFGAANDNITQYRSTYEAGDLNITGIDEAALINNVTRGSADMLAYAQITPEVNVGTSDTLQVDWELTFLGA